MDTVVARSKSRWVTLAVVYAIAAAATAASLPASAATGAPSPCPSPASGGYDTGVSFCPPHGTLAISAERASRIGQNAVAYRRHMGISTRATLVDVTDRDRHLHGVLAYDVVVDGVCVPNLGPFGGPFCYGYTWNVIVDAIGGKVLDVYAYSVVSPTPRPPRLI